MPIWNGRAVSLSFTVKNITASIFLSHRCHLETLLTPTPTKQRPKVSWFGNQITCNFPNKNHYTSYEQLLQVKCHRVFWALSCRTVLLLGNIQMDFWPCSSLYCCERFLSVLSKMCLSAFVGSVSKLSCISDNCRVPICWVTNCTRSTMRQLVCDHLINCKICTIKAQNPLTWAKGRSCIIWGLYL